MATQNQFKAMSLFNNVVAYLEECANELEIEDTDDINAAIDAAQKVNFDLDRAVGFLFTYRRLVTDLAFTAWMKGSRDLGKQGCALLWKINGLFVWKKYASIARC